MISKFLIEIFQPIVQLPQVTGENEIGAENEEEAELPILEPMKVLVFFCS
jgi:hypothetical protein